MTQQQNQQKPRWQRPKVKPNSRIREALIKCREAANAIANYADTLEASASEIDGRVARGETDLTEEDQKLWPKAEASGG